MTAVPLMSVVIPTYNRRATLERCLRALAAQTFAKDDYEVIVVDDGSAQPHRDIVRELSPVMQVRMIERRNGGPASARNAGAAQARARLVAFTDDDCEPQPDWLERLHEASLRLPGHALGGPVVNAVTASMTSTASGLLIDYLYEHFNSPKEGARFFITSNVAYPAAGFRALGGFDTTFPLAAAEDRDLCDRWVEQGYPMSHVDGAIVRHHHALRLRSFLRQHHNYGRGAFHLQKARGRRGESGLRFESARFYTRMLQYPYRVAPGMPAVALSALLATSQVSYVAGYAMERCRHAITRLPRRETPDVRRPLS